MEGRNDGQALGDVETRHRYSLDIVPTLSVGTLPAALLRPDLTTGTTKTGDNAGALAP